MFLQHIFFPKDFYSDSSCLLESLDYILWIRATLEFHNRHSRTSLSNIHFFSLVFKQKWWQVNGRISVSSFSSFCNRPGKLMATLDLFSLSFLRWEGEKSHLLTPFSCYNILWIRPSEMRFSFNFLDYFIEIGACLVCI